jgi:hypothetical protein
MAMLRAVKWVFGLLVLAVVGLFLHYVLPKHAVVYVTGVENRIVSPDEYTGIRAFGRDTAPNPQGGNVADVFFLNTTDRDGDSFVFRNEDTGFGFPFYFKFNSADVQADAQRAVSTSAEPRWQVVRYYGWRINFISMFPNALSVSDAAGPDVRIIPWFNIVLLTLLAAVVWAVWSRVRRWRQRRADPVAASWTPETPARRGWFGR